MTSPTPTRSTSVTEASERPPHLPARVLRALVLASVFICAACGLVYELALVTLGSYLLGSTITQTSLVIAVSMFAMGLGAIATKPLLARPLAAFIGVELALALIGGLSVPLLYASFAWLHLYTPAMLAAATLIGALIGAEIPLLMALLQRLRAQDAARAIANINAVDYIGALIGGLAFPFLLLPTFGLLEGTLLIAALNVTAAASVAIAFTYHDRPTLLTTTATCTLVAALLLAMGWRASAFEASAQQALFRDPIVYSERSEYQSLVLTRGAVTGANYTDLRLYLDGDLQFSSVDEYRYHEMLVHPALNGPTSNVLILGGGDGLALREVLRTPDIDTVTLVDLDPAVVDLASTHPELVALNDHAWDDERVTYIADDAFTWARAQLSSRSAQPAARFDAIIVDFPDPDDASLAKLYTVEMYGMLARLLAPHGRLTIQAGSPFFSPHAFWSIDATVQAAGLVTVPYHTDVPSFGDWGFVYATRPRTTTSTTTPTTTGTRVPFGLSPRAPEMRYATEDLLAASRVFAPDRDRLPVKTSTLLDPAIISYAQDPWVGY